jgi:hypothetical protein
MATTPAAPAVTRTSWSFLAGLAGAMLGCAEHGGLPTCLPDGCAKGQECIVGRCRPTGSVPARPTSSRTLYEASDLAWLTQRSDDLTGEGGHAGTISLGREDLGDAVVLMSFEVDFEPDAEVEGAFLVFEPARGARPPNNLVPLEIASIQSPWESRTASWGRQPTLSLPTDAGYARARPPAPLRVDVTHLVRDWPDRPRDVYGLALLAEASDPFGATYARGTTGGLPPRLEVYLK